MPRLTTALLRLLVMLITKALLLHILPVLPFPPDTCMLHFLLLHKQELLPLLPLQLPPLGQIALSTMDL